VSVQASPRNTTSDAKTKRCGLVIRVSTDGQAQNPEGSLKNQLERLHAHLNYKRTACGETWLEASSYVLKAVSGKHSLRSRELAPLFEDIRTGKVNTVVCTALDRVSRSVKDFLDFFEFLAEHQVEFVSLKQNVDTTTAHGRLFVTIMMALAEFERAQTGERNHDAAMARSERGLWNGGQVLGYDLPEEGKRGTLIPNEREAAIVRAVFATYMETGSILQTTKTLNQRGYRTKGFTSRRGRHHTPGKFNWATTRWILMNYGYIGMKEIQKKPRNGNGSAEFRLVDAAWPSIVEPETFYAAQKLLAENEKTRTNQVQKVHNVYVFNHGLLWCGKCGGPMEGRSGTGHQRKRYYYYACRTKDCGLRIPTSEIEKVVLERIRILASEPDILTALVAETNRQLRTELPKLEEQKAHLGKERQALQAETDGLLKQLASMTGTDGGTLVAEMLDSLAERRRELEDGIAEVSVTMESIRREAVDEAVVREALAHIGEVYEGLPPYRRKDLIRLVLDRAEVSESELRLAFKGRPPSVEVLKRGEIEREDAPRSETSKWLLGLMSQSPVICDLTHLDYSFL
jgi:site-specific DNA recombinase